MPKTLKHDPADRARCNYCRTEEDIHLLDGVLNSRGNDTGKIACIACYPKPGGWCPTGVEHIALSIAPALKPKYDEWIAAEQQRRAAVTRLASARDAAKLMKRARDLLREAGAANAADYVARALKSVDGAIRHAQRLLTQSSAARG